MSIMSAKNAFEKSKVNFDVKWNEILREVGDHIRKASDGGLFETTVLFSDSRLNEHTCLSLVDELRGMGYDVACPPPHTGRGVLDHSSIQSTRRLIIRWEGASK